MPLLKARRATAISALPSAPTDEERVLYVEAKNRLLALTQLLGWAGLSVALFLFSLNSWWLAPFMVWVGLGIAYFALSFAANTAFKRFSLPAHDELAERYRGGPHPSVDVFLPSCGEDLEVLANTFRHVAELEYTGEITVYCLDDIGRSDLEDMAERFDFVYYSRPDKGRFKKAGNLRYAYLRSQGDFIAIFDADFCPRPDFISQLLPYALDDPSVAIVQSPQYFEQRSDKNWLENGAGSVQEFFYRWVMPARDTHQSPICVGTNALYRRAALQTTDGGALVENSEDVHTGFDLMTKGWRTRYVPVIVAKGLCPNTLQTFFNQQHRWCSGSMSLLFSAKFWHEKIGLRRRLTFLAGMTYFIYTAIIAPLPALLMVCLFPEKVFWWNYLLLVPALLQSFLFLPTWHRQRYGLDAMRTKIVYSWAHLFAFYDRLFGRALAWSPTGGVNKSKSGRLRTVKVLMVGWPLASFATIVVGAALNMSSPAEIHFWPPLILSAIYTASALLVLRPLPQTIYRAATQLAPAPMEPRALPAGLPVLRPTPVMAATAIDESKSGLVIAGPPQ